MKISLPHTIKNSTGELLIFKEQLGDKIMGESFVMPQCGPPMHVHWLQDEGFTVLNGKMGYQLKGQPAQFATAGQSVVFKKGEPHCFWNADNEVLHCSGWVQPANSFVYFISAIFDAQNKTGSVRPEIFDAAFLLSRYKAEYEMLAIPYLVRKLFFPVVFIVGKLLGKYEHFKDAPAPVKR